MEVMIVEMMGHRRFGAKVAEIERFGGKFLRAEVLTDPPFVHIVAPTSLFALTPCTEAQARSACTSWIVPDELRPARVALLTAGPDSDPPDPEEDEEDECAACGCSQAAHDAGAASRLNSVGDMMLCDRFYASEEGLIP